MIIFHLQILNHSFKPLCLSVRAENVKMLIWFLLRNSDSRGERHYLSTALPLYVSLLTATVWQHWMKSVCFSRSHWHSAAYLCISPVLEHARHLQTNPKPKKEIQATTPLPRPHKHYTDTHSIGSRTVAVIQTHPIQGDRILQKILLSSTEKNSGQLL